MVTSSNPASPSAPALAPLLVVGLVLVPALIGRVGTALSIALAVVELALIAAGGAMVARAVAARKAEAHR